MRWGRRLWRGTGLSGGYARFSGGYAGGSGGYAHGSVPAPILHPGDGWHRAAEAAALAGVGDRLQPLSVLLSADRGARPNQDAVWREQVRDLERHKRHRRSAQLLTELLDALADAVPFAEPGNPPLLVGRANAVRAVNLIWAATGLGLGLGLERTTAQLGRILIRSVSEPWIMDSVRVRNAGANALAEIGSRQAVDLLAEAARQARTKALREQLLLCLDLAASRNDQPPSRVAELRVPTHGLNPEGKRELTVHHQRFELCILPNGKVEVTQREEPADVARRNGAVADDAAARVTAAEARAVRGAYRGEVARIEALLSTDRAWDPEDWQRIYLDNPITRAVATRLIWRRTYPADGRTVDAIISRDGTDLVAIPADAAPHLTPPPSATPRLAPPTPSSPPYRIRLWHPREAEPAMLAAWREACRAHGIEQPFEQAERDFTRVAPDSEATELGQYAAASIDPKRFAASVRRLGWHSRRTRTGPRSDAIRLVYRDFPDDRVSVAMPCTESADAVVLGSAWFHRAEDRARTPLPLGAIAPRLHSEAVRDLSVLAYGIQLPQDEISDSIG